MTTSVQNAVIAGSALFLLGACETVTTPSEPTAPVTVSSAPASQAQYEADRQAILAMAGDYRVTFDFTETVALADGYELKDKKISGAHEIVRVIEDTGDFISLQHILVVGGEQKFPVKHWRQDWRYEPESVLVFIGGNAWESRTLRAADARGKWSQTVYQVDDSPRYGALGVWAHTDGFSQWTPPAEWRPLPRRDMTTRDDYHAVDAINRHTITPSGWVHEQNNTKLAFDEDGMKALVREIGVNTYIEDSNFDTDVGDNYWNDTRAFWRFVRDEWTALEQTKIPFGLTVQGESEELYGQLLGLASGLRGGEYDFDEATALARQAIAEYTTTDIGSLASRVAATPALGE
ncbi:MAG: DUF6607 family protein [Pseudomonadota bacterium]